MQCTALIHDRSRRCINPPVTGRTTCRMHGGTTGIGQAHPRYKTGRYSTALPPHLAEQVQHAAADPDLLVLREDIALIDSRLAALLARAESGESGQRWGQLVQAMAAYDKACSQHGSDHGASTESLARIRELIHVGASDYAAWQDAGTWLDRRQRLVESERRRLVELGQMITAEQALVLMQRIVDVVKRNVSDRHALAAIANEVNALAHQPARE